MQRYIDDNILAGASAVVIKDNRIVEFSTWGFADIAQQKPIAEDTLFRIYSNTKIVTAVAAMCLFEDGRFSLDDPIEQYLPMLAGRMVLKPDATDPADVEPARTLPTVRQLMCHNAGFSHGFLQESVVDQAYNSVDILSPNSTLEEMVAKLAPLPLAYQPGTRWQYSVSSDVLARLVEIWSGKPFADFLNDRIFRPLHMNDTHFHVPKAKVQRFAAMYAPVNPAKPMAGGLEPASDTLFGGYLTPKKLASGGGGLVATIADYTRFICMLAGRGETGNSRILTAETVALMHTNQLPAGVGVQLPNWFMPNTVFGLGVAIKTAPADGEPDAAIGEYHWGGIAGTHSWVSPSANLGGLIFTQRLPGGFWHPFSQEFKRLVYAAAG